MPKMYTEEDLPRKPKPKTYEEAVAIAKAAKEKLEAEKKTEEELEIKMERKMEQQVRSNSERWHEINNEKLTYRDIERMANERDAKAREERRKQKEEAYQARLEAEMVESEHYYESSSSSEEDYEEDEVEIKGDTKWDVINNFVNKFETKVDDSFVFDESKYNKESANMALNQFLGEINTHDWFDDVVDQFVEANVGFERHSYESERTTGVVNLAIQTLRNPNIIKSWNIKIVDGNIVDGAEMVCALRLIVLVKKPEWGFMHKFSADFFDKKEGRAL